MSELFQAFGINGKLLLAQAVNFGVLLWILHRFLYRPVLAMLDERRERIAQGVKEAEAAKVQLENAGREGSEIVASASRSAEEIVANARLRAESTGSDIVKGAETRAETLLKDAEARAEETRRQALLASEKEIARAAMLAAEKILREKSA